MTKETTMNTEDTNVEPRKAVKADRAQRKTAIKSRAKYRTSGSLDIPPHVDKAFNDKGFKLFWVRCLDHKSRMLDNARVSAQLDVGGGVVTPQEIRAIDPSFLSGLTKYEFKDDFGFEDERRDAIGIRCNDVILMKLPLDYVEDRQNDKLKASKEELDSVFATGKKGGQQIKAKFDVGYVKGEDLSDGFFQ